jgi:hypothetical protein
MYSTVDGVRAMLHSTTPFLDIIELDVTHILDPLCYIGTDRQTDLEICPFPTYIRQNSIYE